MRTRPRSSLRPWLLAIGYWLLTSGGFSARGADFYVKKDSWVETLLSSRLALSEADLPAQAEASAASQLWLESKDDFPVQWDWTLQDSGTNFVGWFQSHDDSFERQLVSKAIQEAQDSGALKQGLEELMRGNVAVTDRRGLDLYVKVCEQRRQQRLKTVLAKAPRIVFTKHRTSGHPFSPTPKGNPTRRTSVISCRTRSCACWRWTGLYGKVRTLVADPTGAIRDPAVSWDGQRVLFAWKKSLDEDDYHLYELNVASNQVRQITSGRALPITSRPTCPTTTSSSPRRVACRPSIAGGRRSSNLYTCDPDGRYLRRLALRPGAYGLSAGDGRWPRDLHSLGLQRPRPDLHAAAVPDESRRHGPDGVLRQQLLVPDHHRPRARHSRHAEGAGHSVRSPQPQAGKLAVIDPARGRQENAGVQLVAPVRDTPAEHADAYGQAGRALAVSLSAERTGMPGRLTRRWAGTGPSGGGATRTSASTGWTSRAPRAAGLRPAPAVQPARPVWRRARGPSCGPTVSITTRSAARITCRTFTAGPGLAGVPRGTIQKLRVVALDFRAAGIGWNGSGGPGGGASPALRSPSATAPGMSRRCWARPRCMRTARPCSPCRRASRCIFRRSTSAVARCRPCAVGARCNPANTAACVGCHEHKNTAPPHARSRLQPGAESGAAAARAVLRPAARVQLSRMRSSPFLTVTASAATRTASPVQALVQGKPTSLSSDRSGPLPRRATG